jgi:hypothetical protein
MLLTGHGTPQKKNEKETQGTHWRKSLIAAVMRVCISGDSASFKSLSLDIKGEYER